MIALVLASALATIPFRWTPGQIEVQVSVNGRPPVWFIVDTGAEFSVLARSLADSLQLPAVSRAGREFAQHVSLDVGPVKLRDQEVMILPLENFQRQGRSIVGLIGYDFFKNNAVTIDYAKKILLVNDPSTFSPPENARAVPIEFSGRLAVVPVTFCVADRQPLQANVIIDTGASESLVLRYPYAESSGLLTVAEEQYSHLNVEGRTLRFLKLPATWVKFAGASFENLTLRVYGSPAGAGGFTETDGALGNAILSRFRVSIDYPRKMIYLAE